MDHWIQNTLEQFGVMGIAFLMLIENIFPPIPSEVVMFRAGYSVSQGDHSFLAIVTVGNVGPRTPRMLPEIALPGRPASRQQSQQRKTQVHLRSGIRRSMAPITTNTVVAKSVTMIASVIRSTAAATPMPAVK